MSLHPTVFAIPLLLPLNDILFSLSAHLSHDINDVQFSIHIPVFLTQTALVQFIGKVWPFLSTSSKLPTDSYPRKYSGIQKCHHIFQHFKRTLPHISWHFSLVSTSFLSSGRSSSCTVWQKPHIHDNPQVCNEFHTWIKRKDHVHAVNSSSLLWIFFQFCFNSLNRRLVSII